MVRSEEGAEIQPRHDGISHSGKARIQMTP
jgi:hypothetical protein